LAGNNSVVGLETITFTDNMSFDGTERGGAMTTNGQLWIGSTPSRHVRLGNITSSDNSILVGNNPGNIDLRSNPAVVPDLHTAKWIVNSTPLAGGNQTSITAAIAAASPGDTIFIMPGATGTYTENITIPANINLVAFSGDQATPHVTIIGTVTMTAAGTSCISNIKLQTNGTFAVSMTGSAASMLILTNCRITGVDTNPIQYTSSSASSSLQFYNCIFDVLTTGISYFTASGAGTLLFQTCLGANTGLSTTASTISAGTFNATYSSFAVPITTSGTATFVARWCDFSQPTNTTSLTHGGSGTPSVATECRFQSGSASAISIGATLIMSLCSVNSTNTNAITGAGTLVNAGVTFPDTSSLINTTTQTARNFDVGGISFDGGTNVLSHYTEGTFVPVIFGTTGAGTATYVTQVGRYTRIGNRLYYFVSLNFNTFTGTGNFRMSGLPFTVNANDSSSGVFSQIGTLAVGAGLIPMIQAQASNTNLLFATYNPGTAAYAGIPVVAAAVLVFSGSYEI